MSAFVEEFLKHFYSDSNWRILWIHCAAQNNSDAGRIRRTTANAS